MNKCSMVSIGQSFCCELSLPDVSATSTCDVFVAQSPNLPRVGFSDAGYHSSILLVWKEPLSGGTKPARTSDKGGLQKSPKDPHVG